MFKSRKSMATMTLIVVVAIALLTLVLMMLLFYKIGKGAEEQAIKSRCKNSIMAYAKLNKLPFGDAAADEADIECPPTFWTVKKKSPAKMRRDVADLMYECWDNYGEGKVRLFSATDEKFCALCSVVQFEDKTTELDGFTTYLMTERIPKKNKEGVRPTYYEYISGVQTSPDVIDKARKMDTNFLSGSQRYAILFTFYKQSYWSKVKGFIVGASIGATTIVVAGAITVFSGGTAAVVAGAVLKVGFTAAIAIGGTIGAATAGGGIATHGADWDARLVMTVYDTKSLAKLGCEKLPVGMLDKKFR